MSAEEHQVPAPPTWREYLDARLAVLATKDDLHQSERSIRQDLGQSERSIRQDLEQSERSIRQEMQALERNLGITIWKAVAVVVSVTIAATAVLGTLMRAP